MEKIVFSIGDLLVFRSKYYKDIGIIADVQGNAIIIDWHSTGKQRLLYKSVKQYISERERYFYYPVVK
jgi:hypothetical protein